MRNSKEENRSYEYKTRQVESFVEEKQILGLLAVEQLIRKKLETQSTVLVAVVGGSATGKTSYFSPRIAAGFSDVQQLAEDDYCLGNSLSPRQNGKPNLQVFEAYDPLRIRSHLEQLKKGNSVETPIYAYDLRERRSETRTIVPASVVIMEGCYLLQPIVSDLFDVKLFLDTDDHSRFVRRMLRPRRNPTQTDSARIKEYCEMFYPGYRKETQPFAGNADVVIENPYNPAIEGIRKINPVTVLEPKDIIRQNHYRHPAMRDEEYLSVSQTVQGIQVVRYYPNYTQPNIGFSLAMLIDDYEVDLTSIGYERY